MSGITSGQSRAAQQGDVNALNSRITSVGARADKAVTGVAMAMAAAGVPTLVPGEKFAMIGNWGTFEGQNGMALNGAVRLSANMQLNGGVAYGVNEDIAGGRVGVRYGW
jgi:hypothetical protein